ncbi:S1C family serine protease [Rhodopirellula sp. MGV]|uniref:S1C family serine protease n=1 Tax=Rhodopirellula sp. MGV TaxID=2023130 RepID=UPI000B9694F1|nr:S1C family serine protease [Rhodopirellula sp. MGV]OYP34615.1 serine protease [Rhodopirellula sp. MGV]PNY36755.1 serine protease [Rhodopirellula baltica]
MIRFAVILAMATLIATGSAVAQDNDVAISRSVQQRIAKVYGAGGVRGLEAYQSGFVVSPEGHIATVWSYVLDVEPIVVLDDGRRFESKIIGIEPSLELAILKIEASELPYFEVGKELKATWGDPVLAASNLFNIAAGNESASLMQGVISGITNLDARRGVFKTPYRGKVMVLDLIANNPGAAGGAVVDSGGQLVGMLGKELRDANTGVWLNYAIPIDALRKAIGDIIAGRATTAPPDDTPVLPRDRSHNLTTLGLVLVPDILESTPVFVDTVKKESAAAKADLRPDDLILLLNGARVGDQKTFTELLRRIDRRDAVSLTIQRDSEVLPVRLVP